jgi:hypothetical protein
VSGAAVIAQSLYRGTAAAAAARLSPPWPVQHGLHRVVGGAKK